MSRNTKCECGLQYDVCSSCAEAGTKAPPRAEITTFHALKDFSGVLEGRMSVDEYAQRPDKPVMTTRPLREAQEDE